jgi:hypothetical protein
MRRTDYRRSGGTGLAQLGAMDTSVTVVRDRINLAAIMGEWEDLARHAIEPNRFYGPAALLPALALHDKGIRVLFVWIDDAACKTRTLGGLFPFHAPALYRGLPLVVLRAHRQAQQWRCTPLIRQGCAHACIHAVLDWFRSDGEGASLLEFRSLPCDGPVYRAFAEVARERSQMVLATASTKGFALLVGDGPWGELAVSGLPLLRWAKRSVASALYGVGGIAR